MIPREAAAAFAIAVAMALLAPHHVASAEAQPLTWSPPAYRSQLRAPDASPIRLRIGDSAYDFPRNTFFGPPGRGPQQKAILLLVLFPEMEGRTAANRQEIDKIGQDSRALQLLLQNHSWLARPITNKQYVNNAFDVRAGSLAGNPEVARSHDAPLGLDHLSIVSKRPRLERDIYVDRDERDGERTFVIDCNRFGVHPVGVPNPGCSLYFIYGDLSIKASFRRAMLPQWGEVRGAITKWMDERRIDPALPATFPLPPEVGQTRSK